MAQEGMMVPQALMSTRRYLAHSSVNIIHESLITAIYARFLPVYLFLPEFALE